MLVVAPSPGWDSLISLAEADAYQQRMGNAAWGQADASAREAALRRAAQYIAARGVRAQYLNPVHANVQAAACEAALRALSGELYADVPARVVASESVGSISVSYADAGGHGQPRFVVIEDLLRGLLGVNGFALPLVRA